VRPVNDGIEGKSRKGEGIERRTRGKKKRQVSERSDGIIDPREGRGVTNVRERKL